MLPDLKLLQSPLDALAAYHTNSVLLTVQLYAFSLPILGLLLAFVSMTAGLSVEQRRNEIIAEACAAADRVIMERFDGSEEELEYLTTYVTLGFAQKVAAMQQNALLKKSLLASSKKKPF